MAVRYLNWLIVSLAILSCSCATTGRGELPAGSMRLRRPVALALVDSEKTLLVANRDSGSVSVVDLTRGQITGEHNVGTSLSDLKVGADGSAILVTDEASHELLVLTRKKTRLQIVSRTAVSHSPVSIAVDTKKNRCFVASLWSRRIDVVGLSNLAAPHIQKRIDLCFSPRKQLLLPRQQALIVADSFGGKLAVLDLTTLKIVAERTFPGHNIRGLVAGPDGERVFLAHQILHSEESTTSDGVHWGGVMSNVISDFAVTDILAEPRGELSTLGAIRYLGHPDKAAADPGALIVTADNRQIVAYAGAAEVAVSDPGANYFKTIAVGRRPAALALDSNEKRFYVANMFSDTISVVDVAGQEPVAQIKLGPTPKLSLAEQGELLFHDASLSSDGWYSCHSCHTEGHSNGGLNDNFGDDSYGAPKRVLSLLGVADTGPWTWSGKAGNLSRQIRKSIQITMQGSKPSDEQVQALEAYLQTLRPPPSLSAARGRVDRQQFAKGRRLFNSLGCIDCHQPEIYTSGDSYDVGLRDELGHTTFNPPSLRGVSHRRRLFHDNRAANLREVFEKHRHQLHRKLSAEELESLIRFLQSL